MEQREKEIGRSECFREIVYTTNALEGLDGQLRKVTKNRPVFPNDQALTKILYLAIQIDLIQASAFGKPSADACVHSNIISEAH